MTANDYITHCILLHGFFNRFLILFSATNASFKALFHFFLPFFTINDKFNLATYLLFLVLRQKSKLISCIIELTSTLILFRFIDFGFNQFLVKKLILEFLNTLTSKVFQKVLILLFHRVHAILLLCE